MNAKRPAKPKADVPSTVLAGVRHGSHLCAFYETPDDLMDLILPFFAQGSDRGSACVWMMPDTVNTEEAAFRARAAVAGGGIDLYLGRALYLDQSHFARQRVVTFWNDKLQQAVGAGRSGMYASGDAFWLQPSDWKAFLDYEADLTRTIAEQPISLLCTYPLSVSTAGDIFDVACTHHVAIARRTGRWEVIKGWGITEAAPGPRQRETEALDAARKVLLLSPREREVLDRLMHGHSSKVIAFDLGISVRTVDLHRAHALDRLNVRTSVEAVRLVTLASQITQP